jgi:hypothetical protein
MRSDARCPVRRPNSALESDFGPPAAILTCTFYEWAEAAQLGYVSRPKVALCYGPRA